MLLELFANLFQRKHALRSYSQALQIYKGKGWALAEVGSVKFEQTSYICGVNTCYLTCRQVLKRKIVMPKCRQYSVMLYFCLVPVSRFESD